MTYDSLFPLILTYIGASMLFNIPAAKIVTEHAPYIKYLSEIRRQEATTLERDLRAAATLIKQSKTTGRKDYKSTVAEFLDIQINTNGNSNSVSERATLGDGGLAVPEPTLVESFMRRLNDCKSDIHTRIISLHSDRTTAEGVAADSLLFCHILGTILDLPPMDVRILAKLDEPVDQIVKRNRQPHRLPMKPGFVSLGESTIGRSRGIAAYIGRRKLGKFFPHVGESTAELSRLVLGERSVLSA